MPPSRPCRESGQIAVETALIIPLYIFLLLGVLQLGLIGQARVLAKYAAYRAARVGAMNNANQEAMEAAALFHLMPALTTDDKVILPNGSTGEALAKYNRLLKENQSESSKQVKIVICGPTRSELSGGSQQALHGRGSDKEVDFDEPRLMLPEVLAGAESDPHTGEAMRQYNRLRLRVQLQLLYRMPIPFANWIITRTYLGASLPSVLMMGQEGGRSDKKPLTQTPAVEALEARGIYTLPINVSYAMRMQSNFFLDRFELPSSNDCIHYAP